MALFPLLWRWLRLLRLLHATRSDPERFGKAVVVVASGNIVWL
jgi:hypothetical protein